MSSPATTLILALIVLWLLVTGKLRETWEVWTRKAQAATAGAA